MYPIFVECFFFCVCCLCCGVRCVLLVPYNINLTCLFIVHVFVFFIYTLLFRVKVMCLGFTGCCFVFCVALLCCVVLCCVVLCCVVLLRCVLIFVYVVVGFCLCCLKLFVNVGFSVLCVFTLSVLGKRVKVSQHTQTCIVVYCIALYYTNSFCEQEPKNYYTNGTSGKKSM